MMNILNLLSFVYGDVSFVRQEDGGQIMGFVLFACLFLGGSGGCAIAIVALVTINEDQDHRVREPSASLQRIPENYRQGNERTEANRERQCCGDIPYTE
jgi:hypothetical protein